MTPTDMLCRLLSERRAEYDVEGWGSCLPTYVWWRGDGSAGCIAEEVDGELRVTIRRKMTPEQAVDVTLGHGATRIVTANGAIGHCNCSDCGGRIDVCDAYCRHCGAVLTETRYGGES